MPGLDTLAASPAALDRPGQAMQNLMLGDLDATMQSMFAPADLTPHQRDAFLKEHGLDKGPWSHLFRLMTNPALIIALAVSYKFPVANANTMFKVKSKLAAMTKRFPIIGRLSSMQGLYRGTGVADDYGKVVRDIWGFRSDYDTRMFNLLRDFKVNAGRLPTQKEQLIAASWIDGLHKPLRGWGGKQGKVTIGKGGSRVVLDGVGTLMPNLEARMSQPVMTFAQGFRGILDDMWTQSFSSAKNRASILRASGKAGEAGLVDEMALSMKEYARSPKRIEDYLPHRLLQTEEDFQKMMWALTNRSGMKQFARLAKRKAVRWVGPEARKRDFAMVPSTEDLRAMGDVVDPRELAKIEEITKWKVLAAAEGEGQMAHQTLAKLKRVGWRQIQEHYPEVMSPREAQQFTHFLSDARPLPYSLKLLPVMSSYVHSMGAMWGWTIKQGGTRLTRQLNVLKALGESKVPGAAHAKMRAKMLEDTYLPMALGRGTHGGAIRAQMWDQSMYQLGAWVKTPKVRKVLGETLTNTLSQQLTAAHGSFQYISLSQRAAGYFYLSTLGMNPASALKNTLQLVLTTGPVLGPQTTIAGINEAMRKSHKYFAARLGSKKMGHTDAIKFAWPAYGRSGIAAAPITDETLNNAFQNAYNVASLPTGKLADTSRKIQTAMMSIFTASETAVRLSSWEAAIIHAKRARMPVEAAHKFAARIVEETQFLTGHQNTPYVLVGRNPLVRQLAQFPLRMLEFATHTAFNLGVTDINPITGKLQNVLGKNPGTFARMIAGSIVAMEIGRAVGVDPQDALLGGAMPTFQEGRGGAFGGFPVVPPAIQLAGNLGMSGVTGDFDELMRSTPLLIPGGVEAFRMMGLVPGEAGKLGQRAAKLFGRTYADYEQPAPDGRIAVYSGKGSLKGYFKPWELVRMGLGVRGGDQVREQELMTLLVKNRDAIREMRKDYLDARLQNNAAGARSTAERFQAQFGFPLPVTERDIEAMQVRRRVTRLEQMVRTMPPGPARDQFVQLIATTLGASGPALLGIDPALLGEPKPMRESGRRPTPGTGRSAPRAPYSTGPFDQVNPGTVGRQALPSTSRFGF